MRRNREFRSRFMREQRVVGAVDHPHILPVYAAGEADGVLYIAARFVASGDLAALLRRSGGRLPPDQASTLIGQVASGLDAAHAAGLVHRDVTPGNMLVEITAGKPDHAYLSDFGLTRNTSSTSGITASGKFIGTPAYSAPEQITGQRPGRGPRRPQ